MKSWLARTTATMAIALVSACNGSAGSGGAGPIVVTPGTPTPTPVPTPTPTPTPTPQPVVGVTTQVVATFAAPWAMAFLPDGKMLVTERPPTPVSVLNPVEPGRLRLVTAQGAVSDPIAGLAANVGLLDVKLDPQYATNHLVYISYMERDPSAPRLGRDAGDSRVDPAGLAVMRATLTVDGAGNAQVSGVSVIWRQAPKIVSYPGSGEPGGRMVFSPDGRYLFVTAGDRQELDPAIVQPLTNTLGKIIRIFPDGSIPTDNPYYNQAGALPEIWTRGHRNPYGLAFNSAGELWENEMGPKGGDELNLIQSGNNYGWPNVSYGDNYDDGPIPKPAAGDGFAMSAYWWTPVIAPSGMIFYSGTLFADWRGDAILSGLQSHGLVRVRFNGAAASEVQRVDLANRIRFVSEAPDGAIWVLEDAPTGRLLRLSPIF